MSKIGEELGIGFLSYTLTHHTRQSALGLPYIAKETFGGREYSVTEYTMSEIVADVYEAIEKQGKKEGILFLDEINCVSETLAPAMLELLQHKKFGSHEIPRGWVLVAAGNPEEYNKSATELDMVTLDRVKKMEVSPDYEAFSVYAVNHDIHESILLFLSENRDKLFFAERGQAEYEFVTPRGWEDLSPFVRKVRLRSHPFAHFAVREKRGDFFCVLPFLRVVRRLPRTSFVGRCGDGKGKEDRSRRKTV